MPIALSSVAIGGRPDHRKGLDATLLQIPVAIEVPPKDRPSALIEPNVGRQVQVNLSLKEETNIKSVKPAHWY